MSGVMEGGGGSAAGNTVPLVETVQLLAHSLELRRSTNEYGIMYSLVLLRLS